MKSYGRGPGSRDVSFRATRPPSVCSWSAAEAGGVLKQHGSVVSTAFTHDSPAVALEDHKPGTCAVRAACMQLRMLSLQAAQSRLGCWLARGPDCGCGFRSKCPAEVIARVIRCGIRPGFSTAFQPSPSKQSRSCYRTDGDDTMSEHHDRGRDASVFGPNLPVCAQS